MTTIGPAPLGRDQRVEGLPALPYQLISRAPGRSLGNHAYDRLSTGRTHMHPAVRPSKPQAVLHVYARIWKGRAEGFVHGIEWCVRTIELLFDDGVLRISCHY